MSWVKLDDHWMDHPKIIKAGRDARDVWLASITWCAIQLTDGELPAEILPTLCVMAGVPVANCQTFAKTLLDVCLWDAKGDGYSVHDYLDYNPSKEQTLANRIARSEAGRVGGYKKAENSGKTASKKLANGWQNSGKSLPRTRTRTPSRTQNPSQDQDPDKDIAANAAATKSPLSQGQRMFLGHFNAVRFKNNTQRDCIKDLENKFGIERLTECTDWAAKKGMTLGQAVASIEKAIPTWGSPPPGKNGKGNLPIPIEDPIERAKIDAAFAKG